MTYDEALKGTPYEGAAMEMHLPEHDGGTGYEYPNKAMFRAREDCLKNAAIAVLAERLAGALEGIMNYLKQDDLLDLRQESDTPFKLVEHERNVGIPAKLNAESALAAYRSLGK